MAVVRDVLCILDTRRLRSVSGLDEAEYSSFDVDNEYITLSFVIDEKDGYEGGIETNAVDQAAADSQKVMIIKSVVMIKGGMEIVSGLRNEMSWKWKQRQAWALGFGLPLPPMYCGGLPPHTHKHNFLPYSCLRM